MNNNHDTALFHYTTADGALGILETNNFFATDIRYLNDISELDHFKGFILEYLSELLAELEGSYPKKIIAHIQKFGNKVASAIVSEIEDLFDIYTLSFSVPNGSFEWRNGLLSQWRSYGSDGGVVLELDKNVFLSLIEQQKAASPENNYRHHAVTYGDDVERVNELRRVFRDYLSEPFEGFLTRLISRRSSFMKSENIEDSASLALKEDMSHYGEILSKVSESAIFFKHRGFRAEREFRISIERQHLAGMDDTKVHFRIKNVIPTPYVHLFTLTKVDLPIRRVLIGPNRVAKERSRAFAKVLGRRGRNAAIDVSKIPFV